MVSAFFHHPSAKIARNIEDLVLNAENNSYIYYKWGYKTISTILSLTAFPLALIGELFLKNIPKLLHAVLIFKAADPKKSIKLQKQIDATTKACLGILFFPFGLYFSNGISSLFLRNPKIPNLIRPFGVEEQYGRKVEKIHYPANIEELQILVRKARVEKKHISIIGAGMSQGIQTVPSSDDAIVIDTRKLNHFEFETTNKTVKVQAGATWEHVQVEANKKGKSVIVKQASDIFSIGGSIGINCHGWAHEYGSISSTVESMEIIDANGDLRTLTPSDELFGCMFGTLGYFGVIVSATLKLTDNEYLRETTQELGLYDFIEYYKRNVKNKDIPLFGGRLTLDNLEGNPLRRVYMVKYIREKKVDDKPVIDQEFKPEPSCGTRIERVVLQAIAYLSYNISRRLISFLWTKEREMMLKGRRLTRNEALHPHINAFKMLHKSKISAQWLQEYFIKEENLPNFLVFLGAHLKAYDVRLINATIRPTPKDNISILPYADIDRYGVVICFSQLKTEEAIKKTKEWTDIVNQYLVSQGDVFYQAYMPFATRELFEKAYGLEKISRMRKLKQKYDPQNVFLNKHSAKYFENNYCQKENE